MAPSSYNTGHAHVAQRDVAGDTDEVLDARGVMTLLGLGRNAIYAACARNEIPHRRIGKVLRFRKSAVMRWLDSCGRSRSAQEGQ